MKFIKILTFLSLCLISLTGISQTHIVQNLNNSGVGSFREAVSIANPNDTIRFNPALIELGSDTLVLDSVIIIDKNLVIKGLYNSEDTLYIVSKLNHGFFNVHFVENIVFDSMFLCNPSNLNVSAIWINVFNSNLTIENSWILDFPATSLGFTQSSFKIENCVIASENIDFTVRSIYCVSNGDILRTYEILSSTIETNPANGLDFRLDGIETNNRIKMEDVYIKSAQNSVFGYAIVEINRSTFIDAPLLLGNAGTGNNVYNNDISLTASSSTFSILDRNYSVKCEGSNYSSNPSKYFSLNLNNCTFNGGIYDSTLNTDPNFPIVFEDYFGPDLDELEIQGCIFNNITGFNELPIDLSGGYNLFGFPQTIGLHPTDLQNVSSADLGLGPLQNNGGLTPTHLPSLESIALNGGNPSDVSDAQNGPIIQRRDVGSAEIQALKFTDTVEHCGTEFEWRDSLYTTTDRYFEIQTSVTASLDTVFELDLTLSNLQAQAINDWGLLTANEAGATYQWIDCHTNLPILGETNQVFEPSIAGNYQVIIDNGICVDTSDCMLINNIGLEEETESTIHAFISESTLYFFGNQVVNTPFRIYNTLGQSVFKGSTQDQQVNLSGFTPGVYFIEFKTGNTIKPIKFVVE